LMFATKELTMESNEITFAVIATIEQLLNGGDVTPRALNEIQKALKEVNEHFEERGYAGFLLNKLSKTSNKMEKIPGEYASVGIIEEIFREYQHYIQRFGQNEMHIEILQQCLDISDDMNDFDLFAAGGYALLGAKRKRSISERYYSHSNDLEVESFVDEDFSSADDIDF